jgi:hypothetical protein
MSHGSSTALSPKPYVSDRSISALWKRKISTPSVLIYLSSLQGWRNRWRRRIRRDFWSIYQSSRPNSTKIWLIYKIWTFRRYSLKSGWILKHCLPLVRLWDQREDFRATSSVQFDVQELGNCGARLTWLLPHVPALQIYSSASIQAAPLAQSAREERTHKHIPAAPLA